MAARKGFVTQTPARFQPSFHNRRNPLPVQKPEHNHEVVVIHIRPPLIEVRTDPVDCDRLLFRMPGGKFQAARRDVNGIDLPAELGQSDRILTETTGEIDSSALTSKSADP